MPVGTPRTQAGISIAIARDPSLVRTVRLVAFALTQNWYGEPIDGPPFLIEPVLGE